MRRNNSKKRARPWLAIAAFAVGVFVVLVAVSYVQELRRRVELQRHVSDLKLEITEHNQRIADLRKLLEYLKTDDYVERAAHEKLGYQIPGEHAVVVPNGGVVAGAETDQQGKNRELVSIPKQWWNLFFSAEKQ